DISAMTGQNASKRRAKLGNSATEPGAVPGSMPGLRRAPAARGPPDPPGSAGREARLLPGAEPWPNRPCIGGHLHATVPRPAATSAPAATADTNHCGRPDTVIVCMFSAYRTGNGMTVRSLFAMHHIWLQILHH